MSLLTLLRLLFNNSTLIYFLDDVVVLLNWYFDLLCLRIASYFDFFQNFLLRDIFFAHDFKVHMLLIGGCLNNDGTALSFLILNDDQSKSRVNIILKCVNKFLLQFTCCLHVILIFIFNISILSHFNAKKGQKEALPRKKNFFQ